MTASPLKAYLDRSFGVLRRNTSKVLRMEAAPKRPPLALFSFSAPPVTPLSDFATGSDADIGGLSTVELTPVPMSAVAPASASASSSETPAQSHVAFHGNMSLRVPPAYTGRIRTGYAAFRNKTRPTLFGEETWDLELYTHLRVVVAYRGLEAWRSRFVVNLQTDGPVRSDLFQHRLDLPRTSTATADLAPLDPLHAVGLQFATLHLPLASFVLTNSGQRAEQQVDMMQNRIRTLGFALLAATREETPTVTADALRAVESGRRAAAGGWGAVGDAENDPELAQLIASDLPPAANVQQHRPPTAGGYHRVGATAPAAQVEAEPVQEVGEGYYELCVRSVEAVTWDPEME